MKLSADIAQIFVYSAEETVTLRTILDRVSSKSYGVFLIILSLPSALPLPAPGYSVPFGILLVILGVQIIQGREYPWFPERILNRRVSAEPDSRLVQYMVKFLGFFETFVRPRLRFIYTHGVTYRFLGLMVTLCGISMCIPVPLTNTVPAMGIFLIGLGMLEEDGLAGIAGVGVACAGLLLATVVLTLILFFGMEAVDMVKDFIKGLLGAQADSEVAALPGLGSRL